VNGVIRGDKSYPTADQAYSDAVDLLIMLGWQNSMTKADFIGILAALDASLVDGYNATDNPDASASASR
jgi:hypothetical protein